MIFQILLDTQPTAVQPVTSGTGLLWPAAIVFALVAIVILGIIMQKIMRSLQRPDLIGLTPEKIRDTWNEIQKNSDMGLMGAKLAVIEADKLLDGVMRSMVIPGETMGDRLKMAAYKYPNISNVWPAHKLRNQLVHDSSFELSMSQAKRALRDFESALKVLRVL